MSARVDAFFDVSRVGVNLPGELKSAPRERLAGSWIEEQRVILLILDSTWDGSEIALQRDPHSIVDQSFIDRTALYASELRRGHVEDAFTEPLQVPDLECRDLADPEPLLTGQDEYGEVSGL